MAPSIKLYYLPKTCSMAGQLLLEDSGLPYDGIVANLRDPEIRAEYVKNVNPKGQVPTLSLDGQIVTEAPAIVTAISQLVPEKHYTGRTALETVRFYEWLNFLSGTVHAKYFGGLFRPAVYSDDTTAHEAIKDKAKANILAAFKMIDEKLAARGSSKFALGDILTGVDAYLIVYVLWAKNFQFWDAEAFPHYSQVFENVSETKAYKAMWEKQG